MSSKQDATNMLKNLIEQLEKDIITSDIVVVSQGVGPYGIGCNSTIGMRYGRVIEMLDAAKEQRASFNRVA